MQSDEASRRKLRRQRGQRVASPHEEAAAATDSDSSYSDGDDSSCDEDDIVLPAEPYVPGKEITSKYHLGSATLRMWANAGRVRCVRIGDGGKRLYSMPDIMRMLRATPAVAAKATSHSGARILYCRVSSIKQRGDLERQRADLQARYPTYEVVEDIASGVNFHRRGLRSILDRAIRGDVAELVVAHRDRLCRVAFELVEHVLRQCGCKLVVCDKGVEEEDESGELRDDLLAIVTYFVASNNGRRAAVHRKKRAREAEATAGNGEATREEGGEAHPGEKRSCPAPQVEGCDEAL